MKVSRPHQNSSSRPARSDSCLCIFTGFEDSHSDVRARPADRVIVHFTVVERTQGLFPAEELDPAGHAVPQGHSDSQSEHREDECGPGGQRPAQLPAAGQRQG
ncbi:spexin prohormone 1 isoform X2 [Betta splendens]|uniref:Spexin prohormone 1 isoform X2 n=1 Tax=Betta splendens TaxID=158456 RepID=A0A6P7NF74_BETSP|nr:spexin prohormone 1 isoform X2 [Betta splendens]